MAKVSCEVKWKYSVNLCLCAAATLEVVGGSCPSSNDEDATRGGDKGSGCWYELWYFWFIVALAILVIAVFIVCFCKQQVKRSSGRRGRRRTHVLTMPRGPPCYDEPGHEPPPYHIAMSAPQPETCCNQQSQLPGCIAVDVYNVDSHTAFPSTLSIGALSNPPPYSPPLTHSMQQSQTADTLLTPARAVTVGSPPV